MACMCPRVLSHRFPRRLHRRPALVCSLYIRPRFRVSETYHRSMAAGSGAMYGGRMFHNISKSFPNYLPVDSVRSGSIKPTGLRLQASRRSSSEANDQKDFGDTREISGRKESMKEYVEKAKDQAAAASEKAKQKAGEAAGKAKETAGAASEKAAETAEKTRETAAWAKDKAKEIAGAAREKAAETAEKTREVAAAAKDKAKETAGEGAEKAKEGAGKVADAAQSIGEKAKQTVQGAWEVAKETTHKIKETVVGKDEETAPGDVGRKHRREKL
ncbi:hypothetical protein ZIOFF_015345 [Zingiber officinale]|uniref:Uncharacterized protein n=1 Tax=Zingiber officinale TaxID=94328 RepID=A0A8J5LTA9_ZINOF|nr:hypothetical protein ZIOFF_015345 [Zingiber officinale]